MSAYYNEIDPKAAAWLRELIKRGLIANGDVDTRSIEDVVPAELAKYTQCHFFAGIGGWSLALRNAGWPDDQPVWTGSCPCQPFSSAGKGRGFSDERHLWPAFFHLIKHGKPKAVPVFGEQVASKNGLAWLDLVQADLEGAGYTCGAVDTCAASVGAPHIRQRLYWVAYAESDRRPERKPIIRRGDSRIHTGRADRCSVGRAVSGVAYANVTRSQGRNGMPERADQCSSGQDGMDGALDDTASLRPSNRISGKKGGKKSASLCGGKEQGRRRPDIADAGITLRTGPTNGYWRDADWLFCRDGKWRSVEPSTFPLAHGVPARLVRLRGYGNAICIPQVEAFISAAMEGMEG